MDHPTPLLQTGWVSLLTFLPYNSFLTSSSPWLGYPTHLKATIHLSPSPTVSTHLLFIKSPDIYQLLLVYILLPFYLPLLLTQNPPIPALNSWKSCPLHIQDFRISPSLTLTKFSLWPETRSIGHRYPRCHPRGSSPLLGTSSRKAELRALTRALRLSKGQ